MRQLRFPRWTSPASFAPRHVFAAYLLAFAFAGMFLPTLVSGREPDDIATTDRSLGVNDLGYCLDPISNFDPSRDYFPNKVRAPGGMASTGGGFDPRMCAVARAHVRGDV